MLQGLGGIPIPTYANMPAVEQRLDNRTLDFSILGDYSVCVGGDKGVFIETAKADYNALFKVLVGR